MRLPVALFLFIAVSVSPAFSHQPYLVMKTNLTAQNPYPIREPDVSKAFYGDLKGSPDYFMVVLDKPLNFYVNILTPDITNYNTNVFSVDIFVRTAANDRLFYTVNGYGVEWKRYFERFGQDWYRKGPEARVPMTTNTVYILKIYSKSNRGRYALATGEVESFPIWEIFRAMGTVNDLHRDFFDKK